MHPQVHAADKHVFCVCECVKDCGYLRDTVLRVIARQIIIAMLGAAKVADSASLAQQALEVCHGCTGVTGHSLFPVSVASLSRARFSARDFLYESGIAVGTTRRLI